jgi:shikimate kinase
MNISLIGMSGVGKSRIGNRLSKKLNYTFIDVDRIIENTNNKRLQDIIDCLGDKKFIELEEQAIINIGKIDNSVISPGGSSIYSNRAMDFLQRVSKIVFLDATLEQIKRSTLDFTERGIVNLKKKGLEKIFEERLPLYKRYANVIIVLKGLNDELIVDMIIENVM